MTVRFARPILALSVALSAALLISRTGQTGESRAVKPLRALLITGGCCHDYTGQKVLLSEGVSKRANVEWTIVQEGGTSTKHKVSLYNDPNWADGYDVVVHNECFADVTDPAFIRNITEAHRKGTPAVVVHCSMHSYRDLKTDEYRELLGVTTRSHGPQHPLDVKNLQPEHPIMKGFPATWTTGKEELYAILKVWPGTTPLAQAYALDNKKDHAVIWEHTYGKGRVFGTTLAHNDATMSDPVYLDMFTRGLLWACGKLEKDGTPAPGYAAQAVAKAE